MRLQTLNGPKEPRERGPPLTKSLYRIPRPGLHPTDQKLRVGDSRPGCVFRASG